MTPTIYSESDLIEAVKAGCQLADSDAPETVTQRAFDVARVGHELSCPRAARICELLDFSWPTLLATVFDPAGNPIQKVRSQVNRKGLPHETAIDLAPAALRSVAHSLGQDVVTPAEYEHERTRMLGAARGANREQLADRLPVASQIKRIGWDETSRKAGLRPPEPLPTPRGLDLVDALERFLVERGYRPTIREMLRYFRERKVAIRKSRGRSEELWETLTERRRAAGLWTPPVRPPKSEIPQDIPDSSLFRTEHEAESLPASRRKNYWTRELIETGLDQAIAELSPGQHLNQPVLRRLAKGSATIPSPSSLDRFARKNGTSFRELRDQAVARAAKRQRRRPNS